MTTAVEVSLLVMMAPALFALIGILYNVESAVKLLKEIRDSLEERDE